MPDAAFFTRFGLLAIPDFIDAESCARLRDEMQSAETVAATVAKKSDMYAVDETVRKVKLAQVSPPTNSWIRQKLLDVRPILEQHFQVELCGCQIPQFLIYREGAFYQPHQDSSDDPDAHQVFHDRKIAAVVFLNSEGKTSDPGSYSGGSLAFYRLLRGEPWNTVGFPLRGEQGLLMSFPADLPHEVRPVLQGERHTVVTWFT